MNLPPRIFPILQFLFPLAVFGFAWNINAADDVLPPPEAASVTGDIDAPEEESAPDLNRELQPPKNSDSVEIRSYQREDGVTISEYAIRGRVYMIKVQPPGGAPAYYLYDSNGDGEFERRLPGGYRHISPPAWVIKRF